MKSQSPTTKEEAMQQQVHMENLKMTHNCNNNQKVVLLGIDGLDPVLLKEFTIKYQLKNLAEMMRSGFFTEAVPSFTAKTPQNWTTIATGAEPGSHGITDLLLLQPHQPISHRIETWAKSLIDPRPSNADFEGFDSGLSQSEFIWNAAERAGKRVVIFNYACAAPTTLREGIWVGGVGSPDSLSGYTIAKPQKYTLADTTRASIQLDNVPQGIIVDAVWRFPLMDKEDPSTPMVWFARVAEGGRESIAICSSPDWRNLQSRLTPGEYSPYLHGTFVYAEDGEEYKCAYKFKLVTSGDAPVLVRTKIFPQEKLSQPRGVYEDLVAELGPFMEYAKIEYGGVDTFVELHRELNHWLANAVVALERDHSPDLLMMKTHLIDDFVHCILGNFQAYREGDQSKREYHDAMVESYRIVDEMVGIVRSRLPRDTNLLIVSDHGGVTMDHRVPVHEIMLQARLMCSSKTPPPGLGLESWKTGQGDEWIDFRRSQCVANEFGGHIYINTTARPNGIVPPEQYEQVQEAIVEALSSYRHPVTGCFPFSFILKKQNAGMLGINANSSNAGDVLYGLREGYVNSINCNVYTGPINDAYLPRLRFGPGMHGDNAPGTHHKGCSDLAVFMGAGPALRRGYEHKPVFRLTGVTPTICRILDIAAPTGCEGGALEPALNQAQTGTISDAPNTKEKLARG